MIALPLQYIYWHYTTALRSYVVLARDIAWYMGHLFSIGFLLRTLLVPWKRRDERYHGGGLEKFFEALIVSALSRVVGVVIKLPIIISGCVLWLVTVSILLLGFIAWLLMPGIVVGFVIGGSYFLYV